MNAKEKLIDYLYRSSSDHSPKKIVAAFIAPVVLFGIIAVGFLFFLELDHLLRIPKLPGRPVGVLIALPLLIVGFVVMAVCLFQFFRVKGTPVPIRPPPLLVTDGLYGITRNPMFSGFFLFLFGLGCWQRSVLIIGFYVPLIMILAAWEIKVIEEPELEKRFGEEYNKYRKRVPMFIPRFHKSRIPD